MPEGTVKAHGEGTARGSLGLIHGGYIYIYIYIHVYKIMQVGVMKLALIACIWSTYQVYILN